MAALPGALCDRDRAAFGLDINGEVARRIIGILALVPTGLKTAGKISEIDLVTGSWTRIPTTSLTDVNSIGIQNQSNRTILLNFVNDVGVTIGWELSPGGEFFIDIQETIDLYGRSTVSAASIILMELS